LGGYWEGDYFPRQGGEEGLNEGWEFEGGFFTFRDEGVKLLLVGRRKIFGLGGQGS